MNTKILKVLFLSFFMFLKSSFVVAEELNEDLCLEESNANTNESKTYELGGKGQAGGIIFYDKGNYDGGWRYLEAAPKTTEKRLQWSLNYSDNSDIVTKKEIGEGSENTRKIVEKLGESDAYAAGYCAGLKTKRKVSWWNFISSCSSNRVEEFNDWFLPSKDELSQMYKQRKKINFSKHWHWSSSESLTDSAFVINFFKEGEGLSNKYLIYFIRCARAF